MPKGKNSMKSKTIYKIIRLVLKETTNVIEKELKKIGYDCKRKKGYDRACDRMIWYSLDSRTICQRKEGDFFVYQTLPFNIKIQDFEDYFFLTISNRQKESNLAFGKTKELVSLDIDKYFAELIQELYRYSVECQNVGL